MFECPDISLLSVQSEDSVDRVLEVLAGMYGFIVIKHFDFDYGHDSE